MAEANHRVRQPQVGAMADVIHLPTSLSSDEVKFAVIVLARRAAREAVKRQLQHAGVRVSLLSCSEISSRANQYLKATDRNCWRKQRCRRLCKN